MTVDDYLTEFRALGYVLATWKSDRDFLERYIAENGEKPHMGHDKMRLEAVNRLILELEAKETENALQKL